MGAPLFQHARPHARVDRLMCCSPLPCLQTPQHSLKPTHFFSMQAEGLIASHGVNGCQLQISRFLHLEQGLVSKCPTPGRSSPTMTRARLRPLLDTESVHLPCLGGIAAASAHFSLHRTSKQLPSLHRRILKSWNTSPANIRPQQPHPRPKTQSTSEHIGPSLNCGDAAKNRSGLLPVSSASIIDVGLLGTSRLDLGEWM